MADKLHIVPILPPLTKRQQKRHEKIQAAVKLMRLHEPRVEEADIYKAWLETLPKVRTIIDWLSKDIDALKGKEEKLAAEDGTALAYLIILIYWSRATAFAEEQTRTALSKAQTNVIKRMVEVLKSFPMMVHSAARIMELDWDMLSVPMPLSPLGATDDEAVSLAIWLYNQSVHPNFDIPPEARD